MYKIYRRNYTVKKLYKIRGYFLTSNDFESLRLANLCVTLYIYAFCSESLSQIAAPMVTSLKRLRADLYGTCTNDDNGGCYRTGAAGNIPAAMSARLRSYQRYSFTYGRVVIRAKMPVGDWLWPGRSITSI